MLLTRRISLRAARVQDHSGCPARHYSGGSPAGGCHLIRSPPPPGKKRRHGHVSVPPWTRWDGNNPEPIEVLSLASLGQPAPEPAIPPVPTRPRRLRCCPNWCRPCCQRQDPTRRQHRQMKPRYPTHHHPTLLTTNICLCILHLQYSDYKEERNIIYRYAEIESVGTVSD